MIIAIGFKVDNERAVQFRKWANQIVKDYTIKGWVMDDERLKNGIGLFRFSRDASYKTYPYDNGRLGKKAKWIFNIVGS